MTSYLRSIRDDPRWFSSTVLVVLAGAFGCIAAVAVSTVAAYNNASGTFSRAALDDRAIKTTPAASTRSQTGTPPPSSKTQPAAV
jgi:hypothetical protein